MSKMTRVKSVYCVWDGVLNRGQRDRLKTYETPASKLRTAEVITKVQFEHH